MLPTPNVPNFDVGINAVVNILRPYLLNVMYNYEDPNCNIQTLPFYEEEQIFGIAEKDELTKNPIIKKGKNDYHNLLPNDQKKTVAFFYEHDPRKVEKNLTTFDLSLAVWFNHNLLIPNVFPNVQYTELFIDKTINELNKIVDWREHSYQVFKEKEKIYTDFDLKDRTKPIMKFPYDGFRIRFKFSTRIFCKYDLPIHSQCNPEPNMLHKTIEFTAASDTEVLNFSAAPNGFVYTNKPLRPVLDLKVGTLYHSLTIGEDLEGNVTGGGGENTITKSHTVVKNESNNQITVSNLTVGLVYRMSVIQLI